MPERAEETDVSYRPPAIRTNKRFTHRPGKTAFAPKKKMGRPRKRKRASGMPIR